MRFQQLRYIVEIVRHGNRLSVAADALGIAQPGVSREIQLLERELGFEIFQRSRNRIHGLTEEGRAVFAIAQRVMADYDALHALGENMRKGSRGVFTIGTAHMPARHLLPPVIQRFAAQYPEIELVLRQGTSEELCDMVQAGEADLAIGNNPSRSYPNLIRFTCFEMNWCVVAPTGHPILSVPALTLEEIARYPLIGYYQKYDGRRSIMKAFADHGLRPRFTMSGVDSDLAKTYVRMGMGIGILSTFSYDRTRDAGLEARDASALLPPGTISLFLRPSTYLHPHLLFFLQALSPSLTPEVLGQAIDEFSGELDYWRLVEAAPIRTP